MGAEDRPGPSSSKSSKRSLPDARLDSLNPNTLYLINVRSDFKKRRPAESGSASSQEREWSNPDPELDSPSTSHKEAHLEESSKASGDLNPPFGSSSPKDTHHNTGTGSSFEEEAGSTLSQDHDTGDEGAASHEELFHTFLKSHLCFVGMEYYCLKYDLSSCPENSFFSKDSPNYSSFVISNIFLNRSPELQFDEAALYDASWEVESAHLCKQIFRFLSTPSSTTTTTTSTTTDASVVGDGDATMTTTDTTTNSAMNGSSSNEDVNNHTTVPFSTSDNAATYDSMYNGDAKEASNDIRVLDGFCGIGGNLVHFAANFMFSLGVELEPARVKMCRNNLSVYGVADSATVVNANFLDFGSEFLQDPKRYLEHNLGRKELYREGEPQFDWVFLSPPWGGSNYKGSNSDDIYTISDCFPAFYRTVELSSMLGKNVTLYLPRCQSLFEVVRAASLNKFKFILVDSYLLLPTVHKIRCCMIHLLNDLSTFERNFEIKNVKRVNAKSFFSSFLARNVNRNRLEERTDDSGGISVLSVNYYPNEPTCSNLMVIALLSLLSENNVNVYKKFTLLLNHLEMDQVIDLVNQSIEIYHSHGLKTATGSNRTLGGTFFFLLKSRRNEVYRAIERSLKRKP